MPFYWGDYFKKTLHLSTEEHGVYVLLIGAYWERGGALPDDDLFFAQVTRMSRKKWKMVFPKISEFFVISYGQWWHVRLEKELLKSCDRISAGKAGANARWHADAMLPTTTPTITEESNKKVVNFTFGRGGGRKGVEMTDQNKLSIFHNWLAPLIGKEGWRIIGEAMDPDSENYNEAIAWCRRVARENGKGWPHQWPKRMET